MLYSYKESSCIIAKSKSRGNFRLNVLQMPMKYNKQFLFQILRHAYNCLGENVKIAVFLLRRKFRLNEI